MLKIQYLGPLIQRADSLGKTLMLEKMEGKRRCVNSITDSMNKNMNVLQEIVKDGEPGMLPSRGHQESDMT